MKTLTTGLNIFQRTFLRKMATTSNSKPFTVVVEGNIGSGKTTFIKSFEKYQDKVEICSEPVEKWRNMHGHNLLEKMYQDPKRWSLLFQTYVQLTMVQEHNKPNKRPIRIMERSLLRLEIKHFSKLFF